MRWWFCLPVNPAYVLVGLLIGLVLVRMWELTDDDPSGDAPSAGSTPAHGGRERTNRALAHALASARAWRRQQPWSSSSALRAPRIARRDRAIYDTGVRMTHMPSPSAASTSSGRCTVTTAR